MHVSSRGSLNRLLNLLLLAFHLNGCGFVFETQTELLSELGPIIPRLQNFDDTGTTVYTNGSGYGFSWSMAAGNVSSYQIKLFQGTNCSGTLISSTTQSSNSYNASGLVDGNTYSLQVIGTGTLGATDPICSANIVVDKLDPNSITFINPSATTSTGSGTYTFDWSTTDLGLSGLKTTDTYLVERFENASCTAPAVDSFNTNSTSYAFNSLVSTITYTIRVTAYDNAGNFVSTCSPDVTRTGTFPSIALSDPTTGSTAYARQVAVDIDITGDAGAAKWCVSETQSTAPTNGTVACTGGAGPSSGWYTVEPTTFNLSSGDATKTVYVWVAYADNSVPQAAASDNIVLDTTLPATPTLSLTDTNTSSTQYTNLLSPSLSVTNDTDAVSWCVIAQAAATADPSAPAWNDGCWSTPRPTAVNLGATGNRKVFVFTKDVAHNVSAISSDSIDYSTTAPADPTLALTDPGSANAGYAWQVGVDAAIGNDAAAVKWCISESQSTKPALGTSTCTGGGGGSSGWYTAEPTTFTLSAGEATKTVYIWVADQYNNVNTGPVSDQIILDLNAPAAFNITGTTGGIDTVADDSLWATMTPVVNWADTTGESSYDVTVFENDGTTVKCANVNKAANSTSHDFSTCTLDDLTYYKIRVIANDLSGRTTTATNSLFTFFVSPRVYFTSYSQAVGESVGTVTVTATLSRITINNVTAPFTVTGTASNPADHDLASGNFFIATGDLTDSETVTIVNDGDYESGETITLTLGAPTNAATGTPSAHGIIINDNDTMPLPKLALGESFSCALTTTNQVRCWGYSLYGVLGRGDISYGDYTGEMGDSLNPINLGSGRTAKYISGGGYHFCAILDNNSLKCWGSNTSGQIGIGNTINQGHKPSQIGDSLPIVNVGTGRTVTQVVTGYDFTCALLDNNDVKCWGEGSEGQLGRESMADIGDASGEMGDNLAAINLGTGLHATSICAGYRHACALLNDNSMKCWGGNSNGQLGQGDTADRGSAASQMGDNLLPIDLGSGKTATQIACGGVSTCAILNDSTVKCWGHGGEGQLGQGSTAYLGNQAGEMGDNLLPIDLGFGKSAVQLFGGHLHMCALLDDNTLKCWGRGDDGRLGYESEANKGDNSNEMGDNLQAVSLNGTPTFAGLGLEHTCAKLSDHSLKCWGRNWYGQLGLEHRDNMGDGVGEMGASLATVNLGTDSMALSYTVNAFSTSPIAGTTDATCVILNNGANSHGPVKCWGNRGYGQLLVGDSFYGDAPGEMGANTNIIDLGTGRTAVDITAGNDFACAILDDGSVKCWGANGSGQLGLGNTGNRGIFPNQMGDNLPAVDLGTGRTARKIKAGAYHVCALLDNNTLKCWGTDDHLGTGHSNTIGDNSGEMGDSLLPVDLGTGRLVADFDTGGAINCTFLDNSQMKCFGRGVNGGLGIGNGNTIGDAGGEMGDAMAVTNLSDSGLLAVQFDLGYYHGCATMSDGRAKCWGDGKRGGTGKGSQVDIGDGPGEMGDSLSFLSVGTGRTVQEVSVSPEFGCALLDDRSVKCWGINEDGQLGQEHGANLGDNSNEMGDFLPAINLGTGLTAKRIYTGPFTVCTVLNDDTVKCWGNNYYSGLGIESEGDRGIGPNEMGDNLPVVNFE